jgi:hypothetical protein
MLERIESVPNELNVCVHFVAGQLDQAEDHLKVSAHPCIGGLANLGIELIQEISVLSLVEYRVAPGHNEPQAN